MLGSLASHVRLSVVKITVEDSRRRGGSGEIFGGRRGGGVTMRESLLPGGDVGGAEAGRDARVRHLHVQVVLHLCLALHHALVRQVLLLLLLHTRLRILIC